MRSTKAGAKTPATPTTAKRHRGGADRSTKAGAKTPATQAQIPGGLDGVARSTKAGAKTPATHETKVGERRIGLGAQRRPGPKPRRHNACSARFQLTRLRSTKAGAKTPATHDHELCQHHQPDRAQRRPGPKPRRHNSPFRCELAPGITAQRRPGPKPRRHQPMRTGCMKINPAQRRPGPKPRRHLPAVCIVQLARLRSTKAGAKTPATRQRVVSISLVVTSLNEGRGQNPGDTIDC